MMHSGKMSLCKLKSLQAQAVADYACAGLFIFQHWSQLTETDIHAIFHLDKTLELIHSEMASRNHDDVPEQPDDTDIPEQPDELNTPQAKELLEKARNAGYLDDRYQPKLSLTKSSILASVISFELELKDRWKSFEILWNRKNMRSNHSTAISQRNYNEFESEVIEALGLLRK